MADDIQKLCLHAELSANIRVKREKGEKLQIKGVDTIRKNNQYRIGIIRNFLKEPKIDPTKKTVNEQWIDYEGKVYCLEVSSHVFMVRRNGKPVWTGNCSRHGRMIDLVTFQ